MSLQCVKYLMRRPANSSPTLKYKLHRRSYILESKVKHCSLTSLGTSTNCTDVPTSWNLKSNTPLGTSTNCADVPTSWNQMSNTAPTLTRYKCLELTCS